MANQGDLVVDDGLGGTAKYVWRSWADPEGHTVGVSALQLIRCPCTGLSLAPSKESGLDWVDSPPTFPKPCATTWLTQMLSRNIGLTSTSFSPLNRRYILPCACGTVFNVADKQAKFLPFLRKSCRPTRRLGAFSEPHLAQHMMILRQAVPPNNSTQGWTSGADERGTLDIISTCVLTLFLCCWSQLVVNVPSPGSSEWSISIRKLLLLCVNMAAPEIIFQAALGQWLAARRALASFHRSGFSSWTIRHTFYVNMGGIHLCTPDFKPFPINAMQLHYLVTSGYIDIPTIDKKHIRDKNKVDRTLRILTCIQLAWFITNIIARAVQGLPITLLELSTAAFVGVGVATSFFWMMKPADVQAPDYIQCYTPLAKILCDAGESAAGLYYYTPMDFVGREEWTWSMMWNHGLNYLRRLNVASPISERPITRFSNTIVPPIEGRWMLLMNVITIGYGLVFFAGWNFHFPTDTERRLWQISAVVTTTTCLVIMTSVYIPLQWYPSSLYEKRYLRAGESDRPTSTAAPIPRHKMSAARRFWDFFRNSGFLRDQAFDTPPELILLTWFFGFFYCVSRAWVLLADVIELRSLPSSAYKTPDWSSVVPHF